jgi:hypothetical protein
MKSVRPSHSFYRGEPIVEKSSESPEMDRFRSALKSVMQVSKEDLKEILAKERLPTPINQSVALSELTRVKTDIIEINALTCYRNT